MSSTPTNSSYNDGETTPVPNGCKTPTKKQIIINIPNAPKKIKYTNNSLLKRRNLPQLPVILV